MATAARLVDYSALLTPASPADVAAYRTAAKASGAKWTGASMSTLTGVITLVVIGSLIGITVVGGITYSIANAASSGNANGVVAITIAVIAIAAIALAINRGLAALNRRWERWLRMDRFAQANGFTFSPADSSPSYPGVIFQQGDSRNAIEHFRTVAGRFLDFGNYQYMTGSGKSRAVHNWGFLAIQLDRKLPNMVLDSRANNRLFGSSNLPASFDKSQILSLEGNFDSYFTLYCPKEYERDALYVFTPDLMALLIDEASPFDVEIVDDWMFVYSATPFPPANPAVYQRLFRIVETVGAKTLRQTDRYQDDRTAQPFAANVVAPQGIRLKQRVSVIAVIFGILIVVFWGWRLVAGFISPFMR
ncbi:MAG: hypothetical protein ABIR17_04295 [Pseudolysinimonas sp.]|uniref:hypothetical protein n=1 Tax=Pseudolysinimonas sp. TaxID=2680009 RepID=UPI003264D914